MDQKHKFICATCQAEGEFTRKVSLNPNVPNLHNFPEGAWVTFVLNPGGGLALGFVCSSECADTIIPGLDAAVDPGEEPSPDSN